MSFGSNPTTGSQGTLAANQFPVSSVAVPGTSGGNLTALEGGPSSTDGNGNVTAPASVYVKDGANVAQGTTTDAAWSGSGAGSEIALLKKLIAQLAATLSVSGTVTANAGTNTSTALLALETGGNLASAKTDLDTLVSVLGAQADSVWSGSGAGSEIAILKKIVAELAATLSVSGTVTANVGTTNGLALDTSVAVLGTTADTAWSLSGNASLDAVTKKIALLLSNILSIQIVDSGGTNKAAIDSSGRFTEANSTGIKTDLDSIVTNTNKIPASPAQESGNLATVVTNTATLHTDLTTTNSDLSTINTTLGTLGTQTTLAAAKIDLDTLAGIVSSSKASVQDIEQSGYTSASSPPSATNAASDTSYTFGSQVNRVIIQNNTSANVNYAFDVAASAGSLLLVPGAMLVYPKKCTVLHLFTVAAQNINGTSAANIVVLGAL